MEIFYTSCACYTHFPQIHPAVSGDFETLLEVSIKLCRFEKCLAGQHAFLLAVDQRTVDGSISQQKNKIHWILKWLSQKHPRCKHVYVNSLSFLNTFNEPYTKQVLISGVLLVRTCTQKLNWSHDFTPLRSQHIWWMHYSTNGLQNSGSPFVRFQIKGQFTAADIIIPDRKQVQALCFPNN